jgi:hypothetical protein
MRVSFSTLELRIKKKALKIKCRFRVIAIGINDAGTIIDIVGNAHRHKTESWRSWHAEERIIHRNPKSLKRIIIARFNKSGKFLPIEPCVHCAKLAKNRGIKIESL